MAKFRSNHRGGGNSGTQIVRVVLFAVIIVGFFFAFRFFGGLLSNTGGETTGPQINWEGEASFALPTSTTGNIIHHQYYTLSYSEEHEQAEWVAYALTARQLQQPWVERYDKFMEDPLVESGSAHWYDYRNSDYERGHLVPAADRAFHKAAMRETFFMSNISPQHRHFNGGIWRELEELTRNWAESDKKLYVVSGPLLSGEGKGQIGDCNVTIPGAFFKVLLDLSEPELKSIAFLLPNEVSYEPLANYALSIDELEQRTGIDFFPELMTEELEAELESSFQIERWPFSKEKYNKRIRYWNKR